MFKKISILGSTGSVGKQTMEVCRKFGIEVRALSAHKNIEILAEQVNEFRPAVVSVADEEHAERIKPLLTDSASVEVMYGEDGLSAVSSEPEAECVVSAIVGIAGLLPTMKAIEHDKHIALANKETIVTAGEIVISEMKKRNLRLLPVDSEHSAVFQCMYGNKREEIEEIILTASGGPFRGMSKSQLETVTPGDALKNPNWEMGSKITIDSSTLMNKGLEVIEAVRLFNLPPEKVKVVVHPQSIVHSMVVYRDGATMAHLGVPDMRHPIQLALCYPDRLRGDTEFLDIASVGSLTFEKPDMISFRCLRLAYDALKIGGTMTTVLNGANEAAVDLFLRGKISFNEIPDVIEEAMNSHMVHNSPVIDDIIRCDEDIKRSIFEKY